MSESRGLRMRYDAMERHRAGDGGSGADQAGCTLSRDHAVSLTGHLQRSQPRLRPATVDCPPNPPTKPVEPKFNLTLAIPPSPLPALRRPPPQLPPSSFSASARGMLRQELPRDAGVLWPPCTAEPLRQCAVTRAPRTAAPPPNHGTQISGALWRLSPPRVAQAVSASPRPRRPSE